MHYQIPLQYVAEGISFTDAEKDGITQGLLFVSVGVIIFIALIIYIVRSMVRALRSKKISPLLFLGVIVSFPLLVFGLDVLQNVDIFIARNDNYAVAIVFIYTVAVAFWRRRSDWHLGLRN